MNFATPKMLWLAAVALPLLAWFFWHSWRKRQKLIAQFVQSRLLAILTVGVARRRQQARLVILFAAVACLFLALARPRWGFAWEEVRQRGLDVMVAIDTSKSMLAEDITPNRLARARLAALDLLQLAKSDRLGLVAFAGTAFVQCPLTLDDHAFRESVDILDTTIIPQGGSALAGAIEAAHEAFRKDEDNYRVLIIFTDGEDHDSGAVAAAEKAAADGIRIFTVGVGTENGELLRQPDPEGKLAYIKDSAGNVVKSRLNEGLLTEIATAADGFYIHLSGASAVETLYERGLAPLPKSELSARLVRQYHERFQWPLAAAMVLLVLEIFLPDRKRLERGAAALPKSPAARAAALVFFLLSAGEPYAASPSAALKRYEAGQYQAARKEFEELLAKRPDDPKLQYNAGAAAYQEGDFAAAAPRFESALRSPELAIQQRAFYNLGNTLFRLGEQDSQLEKKSSLWDEAIQRYESALKLDPHDPDAQYNRDVVKQKLEELRRQQQEQQQQQDQKSDESKKDDAQKNDPQKPSDEQKDGEQKNPKEKDSAEQPEKQQPSEPKPKEQEQKAPEEKPGSEANKTEAPKNAPGTQPKPEPKEAADAGEGSVRPGEMNRAQAQQLLESQRAEEKALIFLPPQKSSNRRKILKDW